jgi:glycosyltransferase involved in cell wall biosynthesis
VKVLQIGKYYPPARGGMETHLEQLCQLLKNEVEIEVIVANHSDGEKKEILNGVPVRRLRTSVTVAGAPICPQLPRAIREANADIIHIHTPHPTALLGYLVSRARGRLVCTYHSDIVRQRILGTLLAPLQNSAFRRAKTIIASNPNLLASSPVLSRHRERSVVVPFGVQYSLYRSPDLNAVNAIRERFGVPIVLAVGRLVYYKGFEFLIRAIAGLRVPVVVLIIGDGPLRHALETEIRALGLSDRVRLLGHVADITAYYQACDLFVLPSIARSEAFGIVQLEAMACGKAVINTNLAGSGVTFVSRDGETGLTVPPADATALESAISRLLSDDQLRRQLGQAGRQRVQEKFTLKSMLDDTLAVYHRVANPSYLSIEASTNSAEASPGTSPSLLSHLSMKG